MTQSVAGERFAHLFNPPYAVRWLPAFAAAAISDPIAGAVLEPFIGPETETVLVGGRLRAKVPGEEHFLRTWVVIKPGFLGTRSIAAYAEHTRADHRRTAVPAGLISLPIRWVVAMASDVATDLGQGDLYGDIQAAAERFAVDIEAHLGVVRVPLKEARDEIAAHFGSVDLPEEPGRAFWRAMAHGLVGTDVGSTRGRVDEEAIMPALRRHLPLRLVTQFAELAPSTAS